MIQEGLSAGGRQQAGPQADEGPRRDLALDVHAIAAGGDVEHLATTRPKQLHDRAERIGRRSLVVLITDLFENIGEHEALLNALRHLRYRGHEVLVFHVLESETERQFRFPDVPMQFVDMETGEEMTLQPSQLRANYAEAVTAFTSRFRDRCRERNIDFIELDTAEPYSTALLAYLNKRQRLA